MSAADRVRKRLLAVSNTEIACLLIEGYHEVTRPEGFTAEQALATMGPGVQRAALRSAEKVMRYLVKELNAGEA